VKRNEQPQSRWLDEAVSCSPLACDSYTPSPARALAASSAKLSPAAGGLAAIVQPTAAVIFGPAATVTANASTIEGGAKTTPPTLAPAPAEVAADIFGRIAALAARIKKHPGYTESIGQDLSIIGAEQTIDFENLKPVLKLSLKAGHPNVGWTKQALDAVEIWVDRGSGTFAFLAIDTVPDYLDTASLPAPGASAVWKYKAIYRLSDEQVGQWSDVAAIIVMG